MTAALITVPPVAAWAQQPPEGARVIVVSPSDAVPAGAVLSPTTGPTTAPTAGPAATQPTRLQKFLSLRFQRNAASVLAALAKPPDEKADEAQRFQAYVVAGRWDVMAKWLESFDEKEAKQVHKHVVKELAGGGGAPGMVMMPGGAQPQPQPMPQPNMVVQPGGVPMQPGMPGMPGGAAPAILLPEDVLAIADACPGTIDEEEHIQLLGRLLAQTLSRNPPIEPLVARLEKGTRHFGGPANADAGPARRARAAQLLFAANRLTDAGPFLPPAEKAVADKDYKTIDLHARYLAAAGQQALQKAQARGAGSSVPPGMNVAMNPGMPTLPAGAIAASAVDPKKSKEAKENESLKKAWELSQFVIAQTDAPEKERDAAIQRSLELMPLLAQQFGKDWLKNAFAGQPQLGYSAIAAAANSVAQGFMSRDVNMRQRAIEQQKRVVDELLSAVGNDVGPWQTPLNLMAAGWVQEAEFAKGQPSARQMNELNMRRRYGMYYDEMPQPMMMNQNQMPPLPVDVLVKSAPDEKWLAVIGASLAPKVRALTAELYIREENPDKALPIVETLAKSYPKIAEGLVVDFLSAWSRAKNPNQDSGMSRYSSYSYSPYGSMYSSSYGSSSIPLTRAAQERNLAELAALLAKLRKLPNVQPPPESVVVSTFSSAHSNAEVFRLKDVESIFGPAKDIPTATLLELSQTMRQRLARQWRQPSVQQQAKTKRSDKEVNAEVTRGYDLLTSLLRRRLEKEPDWRLHNVLGAALFDWAEFDYGNGTELATYTNRRDQAFKSFQQAAALYAKEVVNYEEKDETVQVYQQWFNAALGASDLAYLTRQQKPEMSHLQMIRKAMLDLGGDRSKRHIETFGKAIDDLTTGLPPEMKPRYLKAGIEVVGDSDSADDARKMVKYYEDLMGEVKLVARIDGDSTVGHGKPFGMHVALHHTESVGRESGGFGKYLQNQQSSRGGYYYSSVPGRGPVNYRDDFEKKIREALVEGFDIVSITFHEEKVEPRGLPKPGWRETPLAYVLMKAKDPSVDKVPPIQLDMDFFDKTGPVILPVTSEVLLVDAKPVESPARPIAKLAVTQTLDERDAAKGNLTLDIKASGHGLVPEIGDLLDVQIPGFRIDKTTDQGMSVVKVDTEGDEVAPISERSWLLKLTALPEAGASPTFHFPKPKREGMQLAYQRYADADVVQVEPKVAVAGVRLGKKPWWPWAVGGAAVAGIIAVALVLILRRRKTGPQQAAPAYALPGSVTPFSVLDLLRRIHDDGRLSIPADRKSELAKTIASLERRFFAPASGNGNGDDHRPHDLRVVAERWVTQAR